ncbi:gag-pol, partial [Mucuna pruriens]
MGCMLGQQDEAKKERAIYHLSKKFTDCERRYPALERTCCVLVWAAKRLRQYMLSHTTWLVAKTDPIKYILEKPTLTGQIARWQMALSEYDIIYVNRNIIKGNALAEHLAYHPLRDPQPLYHEFPDEHIMEAIEIKPQYEDEWTTWFDGASNILKNGIGVALASLKDQCFPFSAKLGFDCTNNMAEYEACIMGLLMALEHQAKRLRVYGDSALVNEGSKITIHVRQQHRVAYYHHLGQEAAKMDPEPWYFDIKKYLEKGEYPEGASKNNKRMLRRLAASYLLSGAILYKRNTDMTLLRCVDHQEAKQIMEKVHEGTFGTHANDHALARKILRTHVDHINVAPSTLHNLTSPWPFSMWGIDMIRPIEPKAFNGHRFILAAIYYFTKWVEATSYSTVTRSVVVKFIKRDIICRYGLPAHIITDNVTNLNNKMMTELCEQFKIRHHNSTPYRFKMNRAVEVANKNIKKIVQKMVITYKDWQEMLPYALHGYRTSVQTSTGATPYSLVYGTEAILPIEFKIPSLRVLAKVELEEAEWIQQRLNQLSMIDEKKVECLMSWSALPEEDQKIL